MLYTLRRQNGFRHRVKAHIFHRHIDMAWPLVVPVRSKSKDFALSWDLLNANILTYMKAKLCVAIVSKHCEIMEEFRLYGHHCNEVEHFCV
jgi:hypothetical protein